MHAERDVGSFQVADVVTQGKASSSLSRHDKGTSKRLRHASRDVIGSGAEIDSLAGCVLWAVS